MLPFLTLAAEVGYWDRAGVAIGIGLLVVGVGILVAGAAKGIGNIGGNAVEAIARQPEAKGSIGTNMIIAAALIEGFTFFALIIALLGVLNMTGAAIFGG